MKRFLVVVVILGVVYACQKDRDITTTALDDELEQVLISASGGAGLTFFQLPGSTDYLNIPQDINNPITPEKVALGQMLFNETALGVHPKTMLGYQTYVCATCHPAAAGFQSGLKQGLGEGGMGYGIAGEGRVMNPAYSSDSVDAQPLRVPSILNSGYQLNVLWDGSLGATGANVGTETKWVTGIPTGINFLGYEGMETQAIAGLDFHRMDMDSAIAHAYGYDELFDDIFPFFPESERYSKQTAGLAIAAYERTILANEAPFQLWLKGDKSAMTDNQKEGAILFFGKAGCNDCHTGPALNSNSFHCLAMGDFSEGSEIIHFTGELYHSRAGRGDFTDLPKDQYAFKVPQLYNLTDSPFYGHGGSFTSVRAVVEYKNSAIPENPVPQPEHIDPLFRPLNLTSEEIGQITDFIENALYDPYLERYTPDAVLSGNCFPANDPTASADLGCD